jgi:DivIVA domain-containing protein
VATRQPDSSSFFNPDVAERQFTVRKRGFDQDEVRGFLRAVAARLARMDEEHRRLTTRNTELERGIDDARESAYGRLAARFADAIRAADGSAQRVTREAAAESERLVAEARAQAGHILANARAEARRTAQPAAVEPTASLEEQYGAMEEDLNQLSTMFWGDPAEPPPPSPNGNGRGSDSAAQDAPLPGLFSDPDADDFG